MARILPVLVDSRIYLPPDIPRQFRNALKRLFKHSNPDFYRKRSMGFKTFGTPSEIKTFREDKETKVLALPRGGLPKLRELAADEGFTVRIIDHMHKPEAVEFPRFCVDPDDDGKVLRPYQVEALAACLKRKQGIVRAPTGSGKTTIAYALIYEARERTIVLVRDGNLADQWIREAVRCLGLPKKEIGLVRGGRKYRPGARLTVALQQSLYSKGNNLEKLLDEERFGMVIVDEVQGAAARTFLEVIDRFPAYYRIGFSADETRKDKKEFLIYDEFGSVIYEIERQELEEKGFIHPVTVRMIPTDFRADWYVAAAPGEKDWPALLVEIINDEERNEIVHQALELAREGDELPVVIFSHRREHAELLSEQIYAAGSPCGLMLGGDRANRHRFDDARDRIDAGELDIATGTFNALGTGINMPSICAGICATPIGNNKQFFGQVRGRTCRLAPGKDAAFIYYLWDRHVFPEALKRIMSWNDKRVEVLHRGEWIDGSDALA